MVVHLVLQSVERCGQGRKKKRATVRNFHRPFQNGRRSNYLRYGTFWALSLRYFHTTLPYSTYGGVYKFSAFSAGILSTFERAAYFTHKTGGNATGPVLLHSFLEFGKSGRQYDSLQKYQTKVMVELKDAELEDGSLSRKLTLRTASGAAVQQSCGWRAASGRTSWRQGG
ncbi:hypothetical protein NDU88_004606 [Pleurodeles waltl]|uniref:Uncharacterized protein n=1 Tax=Pleurodeles waltl TaxID=8319 RepID=A0AAV7MU03_PLEWA|nr:hypothetical protein NDU88_004606 [Pleurodeles waltl]